MNKEGFATRAVHAGKEKNAHGTLSTPIYQTSTFVFDSAEQGGRRFALEEDGFIYSRLGNPSTVALEKKLASLENAKSALVVSSGMGAITTIMWTILKAGDHVVAEKNIYGCTFSYFSHGLSKFGIEVDFVDMDNLENVKKAIRPNTKVVFCESPTNPSMKLVDLKGVSEITKDKDIKFIVDNTFCSPYLQRPLDLGADVVIHSGTKFLNGHGDVIMGVICSKDEELMKMARLEGLKDFTGAVMSPFDAFLVTRGLKTLHVRIDRHCDNAIKVAKFLEGHKKVKSILYPGLKSYPQYELAQKQMDKPGSLIAFELEGGKESGIRFLNSLKLCTLAVSLGDTETLIQHPASMTHSTYTEEERCDAGISEGLIRLSVGLENYEDIINDLEQGLEKI